MEYLQSQKKHLIFTAGAWENLKHKVRNFKLEIQQQSVKNSLVKPNSDKGWLDGLFNQ